MVIFRHHILGTHARSVCIAALLLSGCSNTVRTERTYSGVSSDGSAAEEKGSPTRGQGQAQEGEQEQTGVKPGPNPLPMCGDEAKAQDTVAQLALKEPVQMQILQRDEKGGATLLYAADVLSRISCLEVKIEQEGAEAIAPVPWTSLGQKEIAERTNLNGELRLPGPGWFRVSIRAWTDGVTGPVVSFPKVGVGEVFLTSGQSNSANHGGALQVPTSGDVWMLNRTVWVAAADPLPGATGVGGAPWIPMADALVERLKMPVGIIASGFGGTSVEQWQPSGTLYSRIRDPLLKLKSTGIRAVLWHQGENDAVLGTSADSYVAGMRAIIAATQTDYSRPLPWFVAKATICGAGENAIIRGAQASLVDGKNVFAGPDTDKILGQMRLIDACHFSDAGLKAHGKAWADAILQVIE